MKKIMFNDHYGLTQAVLDGRKTMTRRIIGGKLLDKIDRFQEDYYNLSLDLLKGVDLIEAYFLNFPEKCPYRVGDVIAVAQNYEAIFEEQEHDTLEMLDLRYTAGWKNKMFVRADRMPHQIRITDIRIERLQDISDEDCLREGIYSSSKYAMPYGIPDIKAPNRVFYYYATPREAFASLIDKVSGRGTWESNPYVVGYEFELVK